MKNLFQQKLNKELGTKLMLAREKNNFTQEELQEKISILTTEYYVSYLKKKNFSNEEIDSFLSTDFEKLDISLQKKFEDIKISKSISFIAVSTISNYENGNLKIPAWYVELMQKILGTI